MKKYLSSLDKQKLDLEIEISMKKKDKKLLKSTCIFTHHLFWVLIPVKIHLQVFQELLQVTIINYY